MTSSGLGFKSRHLELLPYLRSPLYQKIISWSVFYLILNEMKAKILFLSIIIECSMQWKQKYFWNKLLTSALNHLLAIAATEIDTEKWQLWTNHMTTTESTLVYIHALAWMATSVLSLIVNWQCVSISKWKLQNKTRDILGNAAGRYYLLML